MFVISQGTVVRQVVLLMWTHVGTRARDHRLTQEGLSGTRVSSPRAHMRHEAPVGMLSRKWARERPQTHRSSHSGVCAGQRGSGPPAGVERARARWASRGGRGSQPRSRRAALGAEAHVPVVACTLLVTARSAALPS